MSILKVGCVSDIHLGHTRTPTIHIVKNLDSQLLGHPDFPKLDILFLAGDLFDRLLAYDDPDRPEIYLWFARLVRACAKFDIVLRLLKGTPSHDWEQCDILPVISSIADSDTSKALDFKYVRTLSIEYIERFGINVLYVPDEWRHDNNETLAEVKVLLKSKGLSQVDYAIMHGCFEYQLPAGLTGVPSHNADEYLSIVKQLIFIGHHHVHTRFDRIVAQGSFDRLSHNEEEAKGFCIADVNDLADTREVFFIENKGARIYRTIDCMGLELQEALEKIKHEVQSIVDYSAVRVMAEKGSELLSDLSVLLRMRPLITWTTKPVGDKDSEHSLVDVVNTTDNQYKAIAITPANIMNLVFSRTAFQNCNVETKDRAMRHLEELQ